MSDTRKAASDKKTYDLPVGKGQFVYLRNTPKAALYKVGDVPGPEGAVYTVTPSHGNGPTKRVHHTLMRPCQKMVQPCPDITAVEQPDPPNTRSKSRNRAVDTADDDDDFTVLRRRPRPQLLWQNLQNPVSLQIQFYQT